jgi:hypothetical protein
VLLRLFQADPPVPMSEPRRWAGGLRPAQAGLAFFGEMRPAFIAATLVDLAERGYLGIAETGDGDWELTRFTPAARNGPRPEQGRPAAGLLRYEKILLRGLFRRQSQARLSALASTRNGARAVARVYAELGRLAIRRGWLDDRHDPADELGATLLAFQGYLREFQPPAAEPWTAYREYLPYAIAFGLMKQCDERFARLAPGPAAPGWRPLPEGEDLSVTAFAAATSTHVSSAADVSGGSGHHGGAADHGGHHASHGDGFGGHHGGDFGGHHGGDFAGGHGSFGGHF